MNNNDYLLWIWQCYLHLYKFFCWFVTKELLFQSETIVCCDLYINHMFSWRIWNTWSIVVSIIMFHCPITLFRGGIPLKNKNYFMIVFQNINLHPWYLRASSNTAKSYPASHGKRRMNCSVSHLSMSICIVIFRQSYPMRC